MRLDKFISNQGIGSRKEVKSIIKKGLIKVNDIIVKDESLNIDPLKDIVIYNNEIIYYQEFYYYLINKPKGYVCSTVKDKYDSIMDLLKDKNRKDLYPVGRLDVDTTGVLLISNDGELTHKLLSSKYHVDKKYYVETDFSIPTKLIDEFKKGILIDNELTLPSELTIIDDNHAYLVLHEGKYHQVKKMFEAYNLHVVSLDRVSFAFLTYEGLNSGEFRELTNEEIERLKDL